MSGVWTLVGFLVCVLGISVTLGVIIGRRLRPRFKSMGLGPPDQSQSAGQGRSAGRTPLEPGEGFEFTLDRLPPCLEPHAEFIRSVTQPCVYMRSQSQDDAPPTGSRLFGLPALESSEDWPVDGKGLPMQFIGQLNMSELRVALRDESLAAKLPAQGLLLLFIGVNQEWTCTGDDQAEGWRVIWRPVVNESAEVTRPPRGEAGLPAWRLELFAGRSLPSLEDAVVNVEARISDDEVPHDYWQELYVSAAPQPAHQCLGYCHPIQLDPRLELTEARGRKRSTFDAGRWLLLWQIDTDDQAGLMWGDSGMLYLLIHEDDLAAGRLDRVRPVMQCS